MDKRADIDRSADATTTRDRAGLGATYGDPSAISGTPFTDDTAPDREAVVYESTRTAAANDADRSANYGSSSSGKRTPEDIERDIERTRAEMSETIDEIEERFSPNYIKQEIKESLHETFDSARERVQEQLSPSHLKYAGKRAGRNMFEAIKENPLPAVITGLGLAWWMKSASEQGGNDFRTEYATRYPRGSRRDRYGYIEQDVYYRSGNPMYYEEDLYYEEPMSSRSGYEYYEPSYESRSMADRARSKASRLKHQASDTAHEVGDRASEFAHEIQHRAGHPIDAIRENPIPALLIGAGIAWWMKSSAEQREYDYRTGYYPRGDRYGYMEEDAYYQTGDYGSRSTADQARSKANQLKTQASEKAHDLADRASDTAHEVQHRAEDMAHQAQRQMRRTGRQVQYGARRATNWMDEMMHENPIAAGALMLGVGALVGLALPGTRRENEMMGATRDHLVDEAMETAEDYAERAQHVAERATQEIKQSVKEVAQDVTEAAKDEAKKQGLTGSTGSSGSGSSMGGSGMSSGSTSGTMGSASGTTGSTGTKSGTTGASTSQIGGSTSGSTGVGGTTSSVGTQADRNKSGSNL